MVDTILGRKLGMTQVWSEDDQIIPVTVIEAGPCKVVQVKTEETDGYNAVQIGYGPAKNHVNKPLGGHYEKAGLEPMRHLREVRVSGDDVHEVGEEITVSAFEDVKQVHVTGTSKGKGFAGTIKRHNFGRGPMSHGSRFHRAPGSIGMASDPARVMPGRRMPGQMGDERVTLRNLEVVRTDAEQNLILVKGAVPGGKNALLTIRMA